MRTYENLFLSALSDLAVGARMVCWTGSLFDNKHRWIRSDRLRLWTVFRESPSLWHLASIAGVRPAAVLPEGRPEPEDYRLYFHHWKEVRVIMSVSRKGRHAWLEHLLEGEPSESLDRRVALNSRADFTPYVGEDTPSLVSEMACAYHLFSLYEEVRVTDMIPLPKLILVSQPHGMTFSWSGERIAPYQHIDGSKVICSADKVYGQGVLAAEPTDPLGFWYILRPGTHTSRSRADILVDLTEGGGCA
jgi:hypothetical protein